MMSHSKPAREIQANVNTSTIRLQRRRETKRRRLWWPNTAAGILWKVAIYIPTSHSIQETIRLADYFAQSEGDTPPC